MRIKIFVLGLAAIFAPFVNQFIHPQDFDPLFNIPQVIFLEIVILATILLLIYAPNALKKRIDAFLIYFTLAIIFFSLERPIVGQVLLFAFLIILLVLMVNKKVFSKNKKELKLLWMTFIILFIILEIFARVYLISPAALLPSKINSVTAFSQAGLIQKPVDNDLPFELIPNLDTTYLLTDFKTNGEGLRDYDYSFEKNAGKYRIVVIGDSLTMPAGVALEDSYPKILEQKLNNGTEKYEVINFGVAGYSLNEYLEVIEKKALDYNPDLIIIGVTLGNDFEVNSYENGIDIPKKSRNSFFKIWSSRFINKYTLEEIKYRVGKYVPEEKDYDLERVEEIFEQLKEIKNREGVSILFVALNRYEERVMRDYEWRLLQNFTKQQDFNLMDTSEEFKERNISLKETKIMVVDQHPNRIGQEIFAETIYRELTV